MKNSKLLTLFAVFTDYYSKFVKAREKVAALRKLTSKALRGVADSNAVAVNWFWGERRLDTRVNCGARGVMGRVEGRNSDWKNSSYRRKHKPQ